MRNFIYFIYKFAYCIFNYAQRQTVSLIKSTINSSKANLDRIENIYLKSIINLSREYKIEVLVYSAISNEIKNTIPSELLNQRSFNKDRIYRI